MCRPSRSRTVVVVKGQTPKGVKEMTTDAFYRERCVVVGKGEGVALSAEQMTPLRNEVPDWGLEERDGVQMLVRTYKFKRYVDALSFVQRIGGLAEAEDHHPEMVVQWGRVRVTWWTHTIGGVHRNDFVMAAKSDRAYAG